MSTTPYHVSVYGDTWGEHATFHDALDAVKKLRRPYWGWGVVHIVNIDRVDVDTDGLTEEEDELLTEFRYDANQRWKAQSAR